MLGEKSKARKPNRQDRSAMPFVFLIFLATTKVSHIYMLYVCEMSLYLYMSVYVTDVVYIYVYPMCACACVCMEQITAICETKQ